MPDTATQYAVPPFAQRAEGDDVIIANHTRSSFLCVPRDAVEVLESLAAGKTVGQTQLEYEHKYGVVPDIDDLLETLEHEGFINTSVEPVEKSTNRTYHFENIPVALARKLCSRTVLIGASVLTAVGVLACALDPGVLPAPTILVFDRDQVPLLVAWVLISLITVFIHEMAHLVAARAAAVPSRMGLGNRLWVLVAETDMTGIWLASQAQRCLAFLAGPLVDLASAAVLVLVLFAQRHAWIDLNTPLIVLTQACLFQYLARLLWQFEFFVPTDFYYVIAMLFGCKNLMQDTQRYVQNLLGRVLPRVPQNDLSNVPVHEMRVVRWFSLVWLIGRGVAVGTLVWITLPILIGYWVMLARGIGGDASAAQQVMEGLFPLIVVALQTAGLLVWVRGTVQTRRSS